MQTKNKNSSYYNKYIYIMYIYINCYNNIIIIILYYTGPNATTMSLVLAKKKKVKSRPIYTNGILTYMYIHHTDPKSPIHFSYFSKSAAETDFEHFLRASRKSLFVVGSSSSSFAKFLISSGLLPSIRRRIAIMEASLLVMNKT